MVGQSRHCPLDWPHPCQHSRIQPFDPIHNRLVLGIDYDGRLRRNRGVKGRISACELRQSAFRRARIKTLPVAFRTYRHARRDIDFDQVICINDPADNFAMRGQRRDEGTKRHHPGLGEKFRRLGGSADVFRAIRVAEAEVSIQSTAQIIAVQKCRGAASRSQPSLELRCERRLACGRPPIKPDHTRPLLEVFFLFSSRNQRTTGQDWLLHAAVVRYETGTWRSSTPSA